MPKHSVRAFLDIWRETMWLMTTFGFFDIIQDRDADVLMVRARTRRDLEALRERYLPELQDAPQNGSDYRYSGSAPREAVSRAMSEIVRDIDYPGLKESVLGRQGFLRATLYGRISSMLWTLQDDEHWFEPNNR